MNERLATPGDMARDEDEMVSIPLSRAQELRDKERIADAIADTDHKHAWKVVGVNAPPQDIQPQHPRSVFNLTQVYTYVLMRCKECGWLCSLQLIGNWTESQIRGEADATND
jgi:hypothetical protein